jgi:hypothetical protein
MADSKTKTISECRYWPEIHHLQDGVLGPMIPIRPNQVSQLLMKKQMQYAWYQKDVNMMERRLIGPFNFAVVTQRQSEHYRIPKMKWQRLREMHEEADVTDVDQIIPLA